MAKKISYVVRIVQTCTPEGKSLHEGGEINDAFLDSLRYMGHVTIHDIDPAQLTVRCFDIHPPHGIASCEIWAEMNAKRMRYFGFNAVKAPSTRRS